MKKALLNIWTITRFEAKILSRSWFFRIFAFIGVFIIIVFNLVMLLADGPRWQMRAVASVIPYMNMVILNIAQAIIIAFLATEFLKNDRKLDTTEVIHIRSMSNGEYVLGKSFGTLLVFFFLNLFIMLVTGIINGVMEGVTVDFQAYILYPVLFSLPTLVFILGVAYVCMLLLRNQAVTFVVLLGYIAAVLFYLDNKVNYAFSFIGNTFPMFKSELVGFSNINEILLQRGMYFSLGIGLIFLTILLLSRLRQSRKMTTASFILLFLGFGIGGYLMFDRITGHYSDIASREAFRNTETKYIQKPNARVLETAIELQHIGSEIYVNSSLLLNSEQNLDEFHVVLNPGLRVISANLNGQEVNFHRENQVISFNEPIQKYQKYKLTIEYRGKIDRNAMYLDVDEESRHSKNIVSSYSVGTEYSFLKSDYVLLTQEAKWYPGTRIAFSKQAGIMTPVQFGKFELRVKTQPQLLAISQGVRKEVGEGEYLFQPEQPLPQLSLVIGPYVERSIQVDSIEYRLALKEDHFYFDEYFPLISDTLPNLITEIKNDYELELNSNYPFKRYSIVEVPGQFVSFPRIYTVAREVMQPEMSFLPEKGMGLRDADFMFRKERMTSQNKRDGGEMTETEIETRLFRNFITNTITLGTNTNFFSNDNEGQIYRESFSVFPNYYSYSNYINAESWAFFNKSFEGYLWRKVAPQRTFRFFQAVTEAEQANLALQKNSIEKIISEGERDVANQVILNQGDFMLTTVKAKIGEEEFNTSLSKMVSENRFKEIDLDVMGSYFKWSDSVYVKDLLQTMLKMQDLPGYMFENVITTSFVDTERTKYQVRFQVANTGGSEGVIELLFRMAGGRGGGDRGDFGGFRFGGDGNNEEDRVTRLVSLKAKEVKEISVILDEEPRMMEVNTYISRNLPAALNFQLGDSEEINVIAEEYQRTIPSFTRPKIEEWIVDNSDEGFSVSQGQADTPLRAWIKGEEVEEDVQYQPLNWRRPGTWTPTVSTWCYGDEIKSAHFIRAGNGEEKATWTTELEESGYYEIQVFVHSRVNQWGRGRGNIQDEYHFIVHSDEGEDEIVLELENAEAGWNNLGSYYISAGETKVELTDESPGRTVVADAVKWIRR